MTLPTSGLITVNDRGARAATTFGSVAAGGGNMVFIKKLTASSSGTLSFVDGASSVVLDSTYKEYMFTYNNIHPSGDKVDFTFNVSIDSGSNYNVAKTTTLFKAMHNEADDYTLLGYRTVQDLAQGTGFQDLEEEVGNGNDEAMSGFLHLFNPSSTTFVKHFIADNSVYQGDSYSVRNLIAGYANTTSAVNAVQFKMDSGNIDAGDICLYGIL